MKWSFVPNGNYQRVEELVNELLTESSGIELAAAVAPYGRGKSTAAARIITMNPCTVYTYFEPRFSLAGLIREIAFSIGSTRPQSTQASVEVIKREISNKRRVVLVDEADQMSLKHLNQLRAFHDLYGIPIVLIGEDALLSKLDREGRLMSRVRKVLKFQPVTQADVTIFYKQSLGLSLTPEHATALQRHSRGDFRRVIVDAAKAERLMKINGLKAVNDSLVHEVCKDER